jgi:Tol biopolymer transport system component
VSALATGRRAPRVAVLAAVAAAVLAGCQSQRVLKPEPVRTLRVTGVARLTDRAATSNASWSPDGASLAYGAADGVYVHPLSGDRERRISPVANATDVDWAPDGGTLSVVHAGALSMVSVRDGTVREVPLGVVVRAFRWPPVGDRGMAIVEAGARFALYVISADGGMRRLVYETPDGHWAGDLSWERDGIYAHARVQDAGGRTTAVVRIRFAGPDRTEFPPPATHVVQSTVDPAGRDVAYLRGAAAASQLVVARLRGTNARVLDAGRLGGVSWSPQSDKIAYAEMARDDHAIVWVADAGGGDRTRVSAYRPELPDPAAGVVTGWSPSGRALAFGTNTERAPGPIWIARFDRR